MADSGPSTFLPIVLALVLGILLILMKPLWSLYCQWGASKPGLSLPEGSLGWPVIGESIAYARNPKAFLEARVKRHGAIFKSSLFLRPTICGASPEFARFISTNKVFLHVLPDILLKGLGAQSLLAMNGSSHISLRKIVLKFIGPDALRSQVQDFESIILENLALWERAGTVIGIDSTQKLLWDISNWLLFQDRNSNTAENRTNFENFKKLMRMLLALPVNIPGTTYGIGVKAKAALMGHFKHLIDQQKKGQSTNKEVFIGALLAARDDPESREELKLLDDDSIADNIFFLNFASYDTTSTTLVWVLKFMIDCPDVFRRLQAEQQEILNSKDLSVEGPRLTWDDTRKMVYTHKFLQEVQRYVSLIPAYIAEATEDASFQGYVIPKGWVVMILSTIIHSDPANYSDTSFNPDRFDVSPKPFTYLPFAAGPHMCPGIEMAKLIGCIFVHHITTTYMHESAAPDMGVEFEGIFSKPRGGYPIKLSKRK